MLNLHQTVLQAAHHLDRMLLLVQYRVHGIGDRHLYPVLAVDLVDGLGGVQPLGHLVHLQHRRLDRIALAQHTAEIAVARERRVAGHQQVAQISRAGGIAPLIGIGRVDELLHLTEAAGYEHRHEIVPVTDTVTDTGGYGVHVLQGGSILNAIDIRTGYRIDIVVLEKAAQILGHLLVLGRETRG